MRPNIVAIGPPHDCLSSDRHGIAKVVPEQAVSGRKLLGRAPIVRSALVALEHVGRAGAAGQIVAAVSSRHNRRVVYRYSEPEPIGWLAVGGSDLLHLSPVVRAALVAGEHVHGALVFLSTDARPMRPGHDGAVIDVHG